MPPTFTDEGLRAALVVRDRWPDVGVLVLSQWVEERYATELIAGRPHGVGYLLKDRVADVAEFLDALRRVAEGGSALDPEVVAQLLARSRHPLGDLTPREREVLALMAEGRSNSAIAAALVVGGGAVEKHINNIFTKLGLAPGERDHRRVLAVLRYLNGVQPSVTSPPRHPPCQSQRPVRRSGQLPLTPGSPRRSSRFGVPVVGRAAAVTIGFNLVGHTLGQAQLPGQRQPCAAGRATAGSSARGSAVNRAAACAGPTGRAAVPSRANRDSGTQPR